MPKSLFSKFLEEFSKIATLSSEDALYTLLKTVALSLEANKTLYAHYFESERAVKALPTAYGVENGGLLSLFRFSLDRKSGLQEALKNKDIYYTNDALNDPNFIKEFILSFEVDRVIIIPIFTLDGSFFGAIYADSREPFDEEKINKARGWSKILYPILLHIITLNKIENVSNSNVKTLSTLNLALSDQDPQSSLFSYARGLINSQELCSVSIEFIDNGTKITILEEYSSKDQKCFDPMIRKTIKRETPLSPSQSVVVNITYDKITAITHSINLHLNVLTFLTTYYLRNRQRNDFQMKASLITSLEKSLEGVTTERKLADTITRTLFEFGQYDDISYLIHEPSKHKVRLLSQFTIIGMNLCNNYEQPTDVGIIGKAVRTKNVVYVNDIEKSQDYYLGFPERKIFQSEIVLPLLYEGEVVAVINIESTRKNAFTQEEIAFLDLIRKMAESKLALILYKEEVQKDRSRLRILNRFIEEFTPQYDGDEILRKSLVILQNAFGDDFTFYAATYERGIILLKRYDDPVIELSKKDQPDEMLRAFATKNVITLTFGGYSSVLLPFSDCKERAGIFVQKKAGEFSESTLEFLRFSANFICKIIHNSILYKEVDLRLREIGFLYNFSMEIAEAKDREELFEKTFELTKALFRIEDFYIALYDDENNISLEIDYDGNVRQRKRIVPISKSQGLTAWIIKQKRPVIINDWDREALSYPIVPLSNKPHNSYIGVPLMAENRVLGVIALQSTRKNHFNGHTLSLLSTIATQLAITLTNINNLEKLEELVGKLEKTYVETLEALSSALDYREHETEHHSKRVASYALLLAKEHGIKDEEKLNFIYWGGLLHDIGKIGIPDNILLKHGKLTDEEWDVMRKHVVIGYKILKGINFLKPSLPLVLHHHEWWNGKGYPMGLKGREIPIEARIFSVVDAFDAMTSDRPYRDAMSYRKAINELKRMSGVQFDPDVVNTFLKIPVEKLLEINPNLKISS